MHVEKQFHFNEEELSIISAALGIYKAELVKMQAFPSVESYWGRDTVSTVAERARQRADDLHERVNAALQEEQDAREARKAAREAEEATKTKEQ